MNCTKEIFSTFAADLKQRYKQIFENTNYGSKFFSHDVGVSGLVKMIGEEMAQKTINRAFAGKDDACVCKLRRGVKVTFYVK